MIKEILKLLITIISTIVVCYFAHRWNSYNTFIMYFLIKIIVDKEMGE